MGVGPASTVRASDGDPASNDLGVGDLKGHPDGAGDPPADLHLIDVLGVGRVGQLEVSPGRLRGG